MAVLFDDSLIIFEANPRHSFICKYYGNTVLFAVFWNSEYSVLIDHRILELEVNSLELKFRPSCLFNARLPSSEFPERQLSFQVWEAR